MQCIPLPDELIRKIYRYILPIYDYIDFVNTYKKYKTHDDDNIIPNFLNRYMWTKTLEEKIDFYSNIVNYGVMANSYLHCINHFTNANPLFKKYAKGYILHGLSYSKKDLDNPRLNCLYNQIKKQNHLITNQNKKMDLVYILFIGPNADKKNRIILSFVKPPNRTVSGFILTKKTKN